MPTIPQFSESIIEQISRILAEEVAQKNLSSLLQEARIPEDGGTPKWERINRALSLCQRQDGCANSVARFITIVLHPSRFSGRREVYSECLREMNEQVSYSGYILNDKNEFVKVEAAKTLLQAEERANRLIKKSIDRSIHDDVLKYCRKEYLDQNYFHCVLEASKGLFESIRQKTGIMDNDGTRLVDTVFAGQTPILALNTLRTIGEKSEQKGFCNLLKGIYGLYRTPEAHSPRLRWSVEEKEALDALTLISYARRRIDESAPTNRSS